MAIVALFLGSFFGLATAGAVALTGAPMAMIVGAYLSAGFATASLLILQGVAARQDY